MSKKYEFNNEVRKLLPKKSAINNERGAFHLLLIVAVVGILGFIFVSNTFSFRDGLFARLFGKPFSFASNPISPPITPTPVPTVGPRVFGPTFTDVSVSDTGFNQIETLYKEGITTGCSFDSSSNTRKYCPDDRLTRSAMAAFIIRSLKEPVPTPTAQTFSDVPTTHLFYKEIERMYSLGITTGCGVNASGQRLYCPDNPVTRRDTAMFVARAKKLNLSDIPATPTFGDVSNTDIGYRHIEAINKAGMDTGCSNLNGAKSYCPDKQMNRRDAAIILVKAFFSLPIPTVGPRTN